MKQAPAAPPSPGYVAELRRFHRLRREVGTRRTYPARVVDNTASPTYSGPVFRRLAMNLPERPGGEHLDHPPARARLFPGLRAEDVGTVITAVLVLAFTVWLFLAHAMLP